MMLLDFTVCHIPVVVYCVGIVSNNVDNVKIMFSTTLGAKIWFSATGIQYNNHVVTYLEYIHAGS